MIHKNPRRGNTAGAEVVDQFEQEQHTTPPTSFQPHDTIASRRGVTNNSMLARAPQALPSVADIVAHAAARLNLTRGCDSKGRGRCPACGYAKPTLEVAVEQNRIAVSCATCGSVGGTAAMMGVPSELVIASRPKTSFGISSTFASGSIRVPASLPAHRRRPTADGVAVYDGTLFIGRIVERGGRFIVFNADDQMIGMFADQRQALRAIPPIIEPPPWRRYASRKGGLK
jgi:hypothetical protein